MALEPGGREHVDLAAMKLFSCPACGATLHFDNALCERCGTPAGYDPDTNAMVEIGEVHGLCANAAHGACNWAVPASRGGGALCSACIHNEIIPDLSVDANLARWQRIERAKKRLFYQLIRWGLPLETRTENPGHGFAFRFLADEAEVEPVMTGHESGVITLALAEADDAERERRRAGLGEPYRTLLGHFRHEIAHHYWDVLVTGGPARDIVRALFGDDSVDYGAALESYYAKGPPPDWQHDYVSAYASAHPWEDFAETWAHYFHIVDTLETAAAFGLSLAPAPSDPSLAVQMAGDPYTETDTDRLAALWVPVSVALNALNRSMGGRDAYPFVLSPRIVGKLDVIGRLVHGQ